MKSCKFSLMAVLSVLFLTVFTGCGGGGGHRGAGRSRGDAGNGRRRQGRRRGQRRRCACRGATAGPRGEHRGTDSSPDGHCWSAACRRHADNITVDGGVTTITGEQEGGLLKAIKGGIAEREMHRVFNMGIGMVLVASPGASGVLAHAIPGTYTIGKVIRHKGGERIIME